MDFQQFVFDWLSKRYRSLHHFDLEFYSRVFESLHAAIGTPVCHEDIDQGVFLHVDDSVCRDYVDSVRKPMISGERTMFMCRELFALDYWFLCIDLRDRL